MTGKPKTDVVADVGEVKTTENIIHWSSWSVQSSELGPPTPSHLAGVAPHPLGSLGGAATIAGGE